jgi:hypothetical protein
MRCEYESLKMLIARDQEWYELLKKFMRLLQTYY